MITAARIDLFWYSYRAPYIREFVFHVQPPEVWDGGVGFVWKEMIQNHCPARAADIEASVDSSVKY